MYEVWVTMESQKKIFPTGRLAYRQPFLLTLEAAETTKPEDKQFILQQLQGKFDRKEVVLALNSGFFDEAALRLNSKKQNKVCCDALLNYGGIAYILEDLETSYKLYQDALVIQWKIVDIEYENVIETVNKLGELSSRTGRKKMALKYWNSAESMCKSKYGLQHAEMANAWKNLGVFYFDVELHSTSISYLEKALDLYKKLYGNTHSSSVQCLKLIAMNLLELEEHEGALSICKHVLDINQKEGRYESEDTADVLMTMGTALSQQGRLADGAKYMVLSLDVKEKIQFPPPLVIGKARLDMGKLYYSLKDYENALIQYQKALELIESETGTSSMESVPTLESLGALYRELGQYEAAMPLLGRAVDIQTKGTVSDVFSDLVTHANGLFSAGQKEQALETLEEALSAIQLLKEQGKL